MNNTFYRTNSQYNIENLELYLENLIKELDLFLDIISTGLINITELNLYELKVKLNHAYTILTLYPIQCEGFPDYFIFDYIPGLF